MTVLDFLRGTSESRFESPRTVLGFYAGVLLIVEAGCVGALGVLASTEDLRYLVPYVLAFGALMLVVLIGIVVAINLIDPTKLQLTPVSGSEFIRYQRMTLGDSTGGEEVVEVIASETANAGLIDAPDPAVPPAEEDES